MKTILLGLLMAAPVMAQDLDAVPVKNRQYVVYASEAQTVAAGKHAVLTLHFQVLPGFHVNSHAPKSELQMATRVDLVADAKVKTLAAEYPVGSEFSFSFDPDEKLDVYQGDFVVKLPVVAAAGPHELKGVLHYQACNHAACYPPKVLPISVVFVAK